MDDLFSNQFSAGGSAVPPPPPPPTPPSPPSSSGPFPSSGGSTGNWMPPGISPPSSQGLFGPQSQGGASQQTPSPSSPPSPPPPPPKPANFQLGSKLPSVLRIKVPQHTLKFDEQYFLHLLAGSISLTRDEKVRIVESIPKLKQAQVDELVRIFEEERHKFAELGEEHVPQLEKLAQQHYEDWVDIEMKQEQSSKADEDTKKADEIRKQLGL